MFDHVTKIKNKFARCSKLTALLTGALLTIFSSVSVFASDYTIQGNQITFTFYVDASTDITLDAGSSAVWARIPLYVSITPAQSGDWERFRYLSGAVSLGSGNSPIGNLVPTIDGVAGNFSHFEPSYGYGVSLGRVDSSSNVATMVYFDNYLIDTTSTSVRKLIGYMVWTGECTDGIANIRYSTSNYSVTPNSTTTLRYTDYESGFVQAIVYALNNCSSIEDIVDILNSIDSNSGFLPDIYNEIHQYFPAFWSYLQSIATTNTSINNYARLMYEILNEQYNQEMNHVESQASNINQELEGLAHDIAITAPTAVADIADSYINQIDTTYNSSVFSFLSNGTIILMLCIVFALAILSYLLYGGS